MEVDPHPGARVRRQARHRGRGHEEVDLQHRPEHLGPLDRGRDPRGSRGSSRRRRPSSGRPIPALAPDEPEEVEITFDCGKPTALDGRELDGVDLINELNQRAGKHGIGRIDHIENRLVGIKSREIYEAPAAVLLHEAHRELEFLTLSKESIRFKTLVSQAYADLIYNGLWFSQLHQDLMAFTVSNQQYVSGTVRMKLFKGHAQVVGRKSQNSLYRHELATYEEGDQYDASAALGFIKIHGLAQTTQAKHQLLRGQGGHRLELPSIIPPSRSGTGAGEPPAPGA